MILWHHHDIIKIKEPTIKEQKTGKSKRIYFKKTLRERMENISRNSPNEYIFGNNSKIGHISRQAVWKAFKESGKKVKINNNIGTQTMRKNYARKLKEKHNLKYVQNKLNHDNILTSLIYCTKEKEL